MTLLWLSVVATVLAGCGSTAPTGARDVGGPGPSPTSVTDRPGPSAADGPGPTRPAPVGSERASRHPRPTPTARTPVSADPRWRFWVADTRLFGSPWYRGRSRMMIGFGCTPAPYYRADPSCPGHEGRHHGIDMALPCGTPLFAGVAGVVVPSDAPGRLGAAYGPWAFRIRTADGRFDLVIGHVRTVFVRPGRHVRRGQRIALAGDAGAPDGCHLHFEARPAGASYTSAVDPHRFLRLRVVR